MFNHFRCRISNFVRLNFRQCDPNFPHLLPSITAKRNIAFGKKALIAAAIPLTIGSLYAGKDEVKAFIDTNRLIGSCNENKAILFVGAANEDVVITVPEYPVEDSVNRITAIHSQRGGDASNSAVVYSLLQEKINNKNKKDVYFMGSFSSKEKSKFVLNDLQKYSNINHDLCYWNEKNSECITYAIISSKTGSRTITNKPYKYELTFKEFEHEINKLSTNDLSQLFNLIFFEFKWVKEMSLMIEFIKQNYENIVIATELETTRFKDQHKCKNINISKTVDRIILLSDILFISHEYTQQVGFTDDNEPQKFIEYFVDKYSINNNDDKIIVIPWGSKGAYCFEINDYVKNKNIIFCESYKPPQVIDTLGAGDTFNASFLFAFRQGFDLETCCDFACKCAGYKVGFYGFECIKSFNH